MSKLWQKSQYSLADIIEEFTVGDDYITDMELVVWDLAGNAAQALMLNKIGVLTDFELDALLDGLNQISAKNITGEFAIDISDEDVHTKVEKELTHICGEPGKKIHTGRSRNDQIMLDMRLYCKHKLLESFNSLHSVIKTITDFAKIYEFVPMPGYTHMQRGMPSTVGMWSTSFIEELTDSLKLLRAVFEINDMCPLGSGAGYGVSVPLDREYTAELLGFQRLQSNSLYCQNSRGRIEMKIVYWLMDTAGVFNKIASDLLLFTTQEFSFFKASEKVTTGSSIMPQKRNLDVMELVRGRYSKFIGILNELVNMTSSLPSGYNRDMQETKKCVMQAFDLFINICAAVEFTFGEIEPIEENLVKALSPDIFAADKAYEMVMEEGIAFRDAYKTVADNLIELEKLDAYEVVKNRTHTGSTGNLQIERYEKKLERENEYFAELKTDFYNKIQALIQL